MSLRSVLVAFLVLASPAVAQWEGGGPDGGWITRFSRPLGPQGPLFAGTYGGGIWRSADQGATWTEAVTGTNDAQVWDFAVGDDANLSLYAATEDRGILRSERGSAVWFPVNTGLGTMEAYAIETFPDDPLRIVAGTERGALASNSRGNLWADSLRVSPVVPVRALHVLPSAPRTVHWLAVDSYGVYRGPTQPAVEITRGLGLNSLLFDMEPLPGTTTFVAADLFGAIWRVDEIEGFVPLTQDPMPRYYRVAVESSDVETAVRVGADTGLYTSFDAGATWARSIGGLPRPDPELFEVFVDGPQGLWLGSFRYGAVRAPTDQDWTPSNAGLRATWVRSIDAREGTVLIGTAHGTLHRSDDGARTWTDVTGDLEGLQFSTVRISGATWIVNTSVGVFVSDDTGTTWTPSVLPAGTTRLNRIEELDAGVLVAVGDRGLVVSRDGGRTWSAVAGVPADRPGFALAGRGDRVVFALDPFGQEGPRLFTGVLGGVWTEIGLPAGFAARIRGIVFDGAATNSVVVATRPSSEGNLVFVDGLDGGEPTLGFGQAGPPGEVVEPSDLLRVPSSTRLVLATLGHGVFVSDDGGLTWIADNAGLPTSRIEDLAVDLTGTPRLFAGTFARGAFGRGLDPGLALDDPVEDTGPRPVATRLRPPFPNPFNPRTTIRWSLARPGPVEVDLYDLRGRHLRTLLRAGLGAGEHAVTWDGTDGGGRVVGSGTYLIRARLGGREHSARVTLLR